MTTLSCEMGLVFCTSNCSRQLRRLANGEAMGGQVRPVGREKPQGVGRSWGKEISSGGGRGRVMGVRGRRRWWFEVATAAFMYLLRRFFNGKLSSAMSIGKSAKLKIISCRGGQTSYYNCKQVIK